MTLRIQAAILRAPHRPFEVVELDLDDPRPGEVRVRIAASGVCHSDHHLVTGATAHPMPLVAGHEGAGIVESVGEGVPTIRPGDHVILNWAPSCGTCFYCQRGRSNLCGTFTAPLWAGTMLDGTTRLHDRGANVYHYCGLATHAEYAVVPAQSAIVIRKDAPLDVAALIGCAVATGVGAVLYTAQVQPGESVVVLGCGGVGLAAVQGAVLAGAERVIAVDAHPAKLEIARQFGATDAFLSNDRLLAEVRALTGGRGADQVVEAVGLPRLQELALELARPGGTVTLAGLSAMGTATNLPGAVLVRQEKTVKGSYYGTVHAPRDFPKLLDLYMEGRLPLGKMVSVRYPLAAINEAYDTMLAGATVRGVMTFD
jgi:S-(hydroxymethyl)glutathione dehydrogenase/alcohol dehydrogenase